ncbi:Transposase DDE domain protein [Adhaeretor mobilis]|uniref:Transposase DDE domain protein n=1 Tax=Adhaeretor mobilis TaxID=1930276 RepID=A0A517MVF6_9BACT|nr:Transposase DDE domain protein [Adhaeretor mobilis]
MWFDEDVIDQWEHDNVEVRAGHPFVNSDLAIETLLMLRELFRLPYRQTEGFGRALVKLMDVDVAIPHHTSLQKRAAKLGITIEVARPESSIDLVVDSTGLKVYGEGEWKVKKHGADGRRTWRKLLLAVDPDTHMIAAQSLTENRVHDGDQVGPLLEQIESDVGTFYGDGACDQWKVHDSLAEQEIEAVIPPRKNAKIKQHGNSNEKPLPRDEAIRDIRLLGRKEWKQDVGYHRRSLAETAMFRMKNTFGGKLNKRSLPNQITETAFRCKILNLFVTLGMPAFLWN